MKTKSLMFAILVVALMFSGCASFDAAGKKPNLVDPSSLSDKKKMSTKVGNGLDVSIYPITTREEAEKFFDEDLIDKKILAIAVDIQAETEVDLISATLKLADGKKITPMDKEDVYAVVKRDWKGRSFVWWFAGYIGAPISAYHTSKTNEKIHQDIVENGKLLSLGNIAKGTTTGFLCFRVPDVITVRGKLNLLFKKLDYFDFNLDIR